MLTESRRLALGFTLRFFLLVFLITGFSRVDRALWDHRVFNTIT